MIVIIIQGVSLASTNVSHATVLVGDRFRGAVSISFRSLIDLRHRRWRLVVR